MKCHVMIAVLAVLMTGAVAAQTTPQHAASADKARDALWKEYDELQPKIHECLVAIEKATRNDNVWQEESLTLAECKARGYQSIDVGQRMMRYGLTPPSSPQEEEE
jgi:hypothetical protein